MSGVWRRQCHCQYILDYTFGLDTLTECWRCFHGGKSIAQQTVCIRHSADIVPGGIHYHLTVLLAAEEIHYTLPTWLLKEAITLLAPHKMTTISLTKWYFPRSLRPAIAMRLLEKAGYRSHLHRLVSNLPFLSKVCERFINLIRYLNEFHLLPDSFSVTILTISLNGNLCLESILSYNHDNRWNRQWQDCSLIITWFNGSFRHRRVFLLQWL